MDEKQESDIICAVDAEEAVIGSLIIAPEMLADVELVISAEQFYVNRFSWIFSAMQRIKKTGSAIDYLTLIQELDTTKQLDGIGGASEITRLMANVPNAYNVIHYAKIVNETYIRRQMIDVSSKIAKLAFGEQWPIDKIHQKSVELVANCFSSVASAGNGITANEAMSQQYDMMEMRALGQYITIPTGFIDLDYLLGGGPVGGDLVLIGGRPGMGKTALMLDMFANFSSKNKETKKFALFFSLEMPSSQLSNRLVAKWGIESQNLKSGLLTEGEYKIYMEDVLPEVSTWNFILDDTPGLRPDQLRNKLSKHLSQHDIGIVFVDYIQLMTASGFKGGDNRVAEVSAISRELKLIAREFDIPIIAGAQLSRASEQRAVKKPVLSDLRESGSLEQDSDIVIFIHRPEVYEDDPSKQNISEIIVAKHRNGATGTINLIFRKNYMRFDNAVTRRVDLNGEYKDGRREWAE